MVVSITLNVKRYVVPIPPGKRQLALSYGWTARTLMFSSLVRYNLPEEILKEKGQFSYGMPKQESDKYDGKEILFPRGGEKETEEAHQRYVFSHGSYNPGEMIDRKYASSWLCASS